MAYAKPVPAVDGNTSYDAARDQHMQDGIEAAALAADAAAALAADAAAAVGKINGVAVAGTPTAGQVPVASSGTTAAWAAPSAPAPADGSITAAKLDTPLNNTIAGKASSVDLLALGAANANPFETVAYNRYGHSYVFGVGASVAGAAWTARIPGILRTSGGTNWGISATTQSEIASRILGSWIPGSRGLVTIMGALNSVNYLENQAAVVQALRASLAVLMSRSKKDLTWNGMNFNGTWATAPTVTINGSTTIDSAAGLRTTTVGDSVDVILPEGKGYVLVQMNTGTAGGLITATRSVTGAVIGTYDTGSAGQYVMHSPVAPMVIPLLNEAAGSTVRLTLTSGTSFVVHGALLPNTVNPPLTAIVQEGPTVGYAVSNPNTRDQNDALLASFHVANAVMIAAEFPSVQVINLASLGWNRDTMVSTDLIHPHDGGHGWIAKTVIAELLRRITTWVDGLNVLAPSPNVPTNGPTGYYVGSPTVPPAPTLGVGGGIGGSFNASANQRATGGSDITSYRWQYRTTAGPGTWTSVANTTGSTTTYTLTAGTAYDFRAAAANAIGQGAWSSTVSVVPPVAYDSFDRADASTLGTTTSGQVWTSQSGNGIISNQAGGAANPVANASAFDAGLADCTVSFTAATIGQCGIVIRYSDASNYILLACGGAGATWNLSKRVAGTFTTLYTSSVAAASGDVVALTGAGNQLSYKINGVPVTTVTDVFNQTATKVGLRISDAVARVDNLAVATS